MAYPGALDSFTTKTDGVDIYLAAHMNAVQDSIVAIQTELGTDPAGSLTDLKTRLAVSLSGAGLLNFAASSVLTIASGSITTTKNWHRVDTEASAETDNLDTITAGADGQLLLLRAASDVRDVVIRHGIGNIVCGGGGNIVLGLAADLAILIYDSNLTKWICDGFFSTARANVWTGAQQFNAAIGRAYAGYNANGPLDATHQFVVADAASVPITITLPAAGSCMGRWYTIKKGDASANAVTIDGNASETIDGATTYVLSSQYDKVSIISNGSAWYTV